MKTSKDEKKKVTKKVTTKPTKKKVKKEGFFIGLKKELSQVKWPTFKEVLKYTISTVVFCVIICAFFLLLYFLLTTVVGEL